MPDTTLNVPEATPRLPEDESEGTKSRAKMAVQIFGFLIGIGLMVWVIGAVLSPENQQKLARLREATPQQLLGLLGLSALIIVVSGEVFRRSLAPVKRLPILGLHATNVIACLLALLPFKLSIVFRVIVHNRRDKVPLLTIGAWFAAVSVITLLAVIPILGAGIARGTPDLAWYAISIGGIVVGIGVMLAIARALSRESTWEWFKGVWGRLPLPKALKSHGLMERAHEGVRMLASPGAVLACTGLRMADICVQAFRFMLAATILDQPLSWDQAVLAGGAYFLIGAAAPTGQLGAREAGTAGLLATLVPYIELRTFATVVLVISGSEMIVLLAGSAIGVAYLRPDRLLRLGHKPKS